MSTQPKLVYLASYPKSGNTWLRIFLGYLMLGEKMDINKMNRDSRITSSRPFFDEIASLESHELKPSEIDYYKPIVIKHFANAQNKITFMKSHEAYLKNDYGSWILPQGNEYKTVYIVRNPLDVCVSYAHHGGKSKFDKTIHFMGEGAKNTKGNYNQIEHYMGSWSDHLNSWTENFPRENLLLIRYEDMLNESLKTFSKIVQFLGLAYDSNQISKAIALASFDRLQQIEEKKPFSEKPAKSKRFFRKGKIGSWREELSEVQINTITTFHKKNMTKLGYLPLQ